MVLINLNAIFPLKLCCNFSYKKLFQNVGIMNACGLWSFVYSINFQIRQIQARNQHFSGEKSLLMCGSRLLKKKKKKVFFTNFPFLTDSPKPLTPLIAKICLASQNVFVQFSLKCFLKIFLRIIRQSNMVIRFQLQIL